MKENNTFLVLGVALIAVLSMLGLASAQSRPPMPGPGMMSQSQMPMSPAQMQQQMAQMSATVKALRAQLNKINPDLLTGQERPMYEYLKLLQTHLETMQGMMGSMQGMMMQIPGMMGR
jgi:TolA-binding protein